MKYGVVVAWVIAILGMLWKWFQQPNGHLSGVGIWETIGAVVGVTLLGAMAGGISAGLRNIGASRWHGRRLPLMPAYLSMPLWEAAISGALSFLIIWSTAMVVIALLATLSTSERLDIVLFFAPAPISFIFGAAFMTVVAATRNYFSNYSIL